MYKWLLNSSVPPKKNKSKIFEKDYEFRTDNVNVEDDEAFQMSAQHLTRQLKKGLRNAQGEFHSSDCWGLRISAKFPIKTPKGRVLEIKSSWISKFKMEQCRPDPVLQQRSSPEVPNTQASAANILDVVSFKTDIPQNDVQAGMQGIIIDNLDSQHVLVEMYDGDLWLVPVHLTKIKVLDP